MIFEIFTFFFFFASPATPVFVMLENGRSGTFYKEVVAGSSPVLSCSYTITQSGNVADASVEWKYSRNASGSTAQHITFEGQVQKRFRDQLSIQEQSGLRFDEVRVENTGYYTCEVVIIDDTPSQSSATYNLAVLVQPSVPVCTFPENRGIPLGQSAAFYCNSSEGIPTPTYTWYKDRVALPDQSMQSFPRNTSVWANTSFSVNSQTGVLTFTKVVPGDAGEYYCISQNKVGTEQCQAVQIVTTYVEEPSVPVCTFPEDRTITIGSSAELFCNSSTGIPAPTYRWYKNGVVLSDQRNGNISKSSNASVSVDERTGVLTFAKVVSDDTGEYYCVSQNEAGTKQCQAAKIVAESSSWVVHQKVFTSMLFFPSITTVILLRATL